MMKRSHHNNLTWFLAGFASLCALAGYRTTEVQLADPAVQDQDPNQCCSDSNLNTPENTRLAAQYNR